MVCFTREHEKDSRTIYKIIVDDGSGNLNVFQTDGHFLVFPRNTH